MYVSLMCTYCTLLLFTSIPFVLMWVYWRLRGVTEKCWKPWSTEHDCVDVVSKAAGKTGTRKQFHLLENVKDIFQQALKTILCEEVMITFAEMSKYTVNPDGGTQTQADTTKDMRGFKQKFHPGSQCTSVAKQTCLLVSIQSFDFQRQHVTVFNKDFLLIINPHRWLHLGHQGISSSSQGCKG